ncbi:MAG: hypothetical protein K9K67_10155 [Bacteriovoracaceae bacterium]|nr:hypothetical protein [Bacteriovoracaceae bacterium]
MNSKIKETPEYFKHKPNKSYERSYIQNKIRIETEWKCINSTTDDSGPSSISNQYIAEVLINGKRINDDFVGYCGC